MRNKNTLNRANGLAKQILMLTKNSLIVSLRFLDLALSQFEFVPLLEGTISSDGQKFYYNIEYILKEYKESKKEVNRDYLHLLLHYIFYHPFVSASIKRDYWNLACDIAIENIITEMELLQTNSPKEASQQPIINELKTEIGVLTAEKIYRYMIDGEYLEEKIQQLQRLFFRDNHDIWYSKSDNLTTRSEIESEEKSSHLEIKERWKDISERTMIDLETASKNWGDRSNSLLQNIVSVNREKYNYKEFLMRFAEMGEVMQVNDDEFDYIYYTYGLKLFKKMPLIEPLEYKESKRIKEFVIAIDTSGSCSGEIVQNFIQKTYNILQETETFFSKINVHIIQCDAEIQEDYKISNQEEFDELLKDFKIKGFGGTDFRPVFEYVDTLINKGEFRNLKGLIYFTDGYGDFPAVPPDYETAFVFLGADEVHPQVPVWAIKLVLDKEEIN